MLAMPFHEFFAGSGLVSVGLTPKFKAVWANDISEVKARVYRANLGDSVLSVGDISDVAGSSLPSAMLSWASFPCQDLSLAGNSKGIRAERSGLVWQWLRIIDEQGGQAPRVVCLENVSGLVSSDNSRNYHELHSALIERGYSTGAILLNANRFVPQSRPRVFIIGTRGMIPSGVISDGPTWLHPSPVRRAAECLKDFVWWHASPPAPMNRVLSDIVDNVPFDKDDVVRLIPQKHMEKFFASEFNYAAGYKRTRDHKQVLELRCDGLAGCLRTPTGGSSRQYIVKREGHRIHARLMTVRETARLMGAPEAFLLPGSYNDGYMAMGDAVVVPVVNWLAERFLSILVEAAYYDD